MRAVRVVCTVMAVVLLGAAATVALVPLPAPAAGGTCGPGTASESAAAAFFDPASIGAGPEPAAASASRPAWQSFVDDCQTAADTHMLVVGALVVGALVVGLAVPAVVRRLAKERPSAAVGGGPMAPAAWYPDPADPNALRWWDGTAWGPTHVVPPDQRSSVAAP